MKFHVVTLFPKTLDSYLDESIISRAIEDGKIKVEFYNPRDYSMDKWKRVDSKPYSGGPGMVLEALPVVKAIEKALSKVKKNKKAKVKIIFLSPGGVQFTTDYAKAAAKKFTDIVIVSGRYEGIDARVKKIFKKGYAMEDVSIGPFVLTGGEIPAMAIIDSISRQIPGVLGNLNSLEESRVSSHEVYTRPEIIEHKGKKYRVPKVLLSGHHEKIEKWKMRK